MSFKVYNSKVFLGEIFIKQDEDKICIRDYEVDSLIKKLQKCKEKWERFKEQK